MHKKILRISIMLATILIMIIQANGLERFILDPNDFQNYTIKNRPMTITPGTLCWENRTIDPIQCLDHPGMLEYIVSAKNSAGPNVLRGQRVTLNFNETHKMSEWDELDCLGKVAYGFIATVMCPIIFPCVCYSCFCKHDVQSMQQSIGQINFESQPRTIRLKLGATTGSLLLSPENG